MVAGKDKAEEPWPGIAEELEQLTGSKGAPSLRPKMVADSTLDPVTRWWIEATGELPTPEEVRKFRPRIEKLLRRERNAIRDDARRLLDHDPGFGPLDLADFAEISARLGRDIAKEIDVERLNECLAEEKRARARKRATPPRIDPKAARMAHSANEERKARKAASERKRADAKTKRASATGAKKRSRVSGKKAPRSLDRDRKIVAEIQGFLEADVPVRLTLKKAEVVHPGSVSPLSPPSTKGRSTTHDPVIWLPHWEKASLPLRATAMGIACGERGGLAFTLHLGDSGIKHAKGVGEIMFARRLYKRIEETLAKRDYRHLPEIDVMFFVEQGKGERPHLHGIVLPADKLTRTTKASLRKALREAAGDDWKPSGHDRTQAELGLLYEPVGWLAYITKFTEITKVEIGDNVFASSRRITKLGREWYEQARRDRRLLLPGTAVASAKPAQ